MRSNPLRCTRTAVLAAVVPLACAVSGGGEDNGAGTDGPGTSVTAGSEGSGAGSEGSGGGPGETGGTGGAGAGTAGCGRAADITAGEWTAQTLMVGDVEREYWLYLPPNYDPQRAYPVVYQFHGCSDGEDRYRNNVAIEKESGDEAILVRGKALERCWDYQADGADLAFFDGLVEQIEASWCADAERRFANGYSSGASMSHLFGCVRGDKLRAVATVAAGNGRSQCEGQVAALLIHDTTDNTVDISSSRDARDVHLARNGCEPGGEPAAVDPEPCRSYPGCDEGYPVIWCETEGRGHSSQGDLAAPAFWQFFAGF